jgi:hypothetical protein
MIGVPVAGAEILAARHQAIAKTAERDEVEGQYAAADIEEKAAAPQRVQHAENSRAELFDCDSRRLTIGFIFDLSGSHPHHEAARVGPMVSGGRHLKARNCRPERHRGSALSPCEQPPGMRPMARRSPGSKRYRPLDGSFADRFILFTLLAGRAVATGCFARRHHDPPRHRANALAGPRYHLQYIGKAGAIQFNIVLMTDPGMQKPSWPFRSSREFLKNCERRARFRA